MDTKPIADSDACPVASNLPLCRFGVQMRSTWFDAIAKYGPGLVRGAMALPVGALAVLGAAG